MPNGFYELVRYLALVGFVFLAVMANKKGNEKDFLHFYCAGCVVSACFKNFIRQDLLESGGRRCSGMAFVFCF